MNIKIINKSKNELPTYSTPGSSGMDIRADIDESLTINPMERVLIPTGLYPQIPTGYELQIRARSGLAINHGISLVNGIGTIDSDYRGEIGVILINLGEENFVIHPGDRIAQMVGARFETINIEEVKSLDETSRGEGGYGSSGIE